MSFDAILLFQQFNGINGFINYNSHTKESYQNMYMHLFQQKQKSIHTHTKTEMNISDDFFQRGRVKGVL